MQCVAKTVVVIITGLFCACLIYRCLWSADVNSSAPPAAAAHPLIDVLEEYRRKNGEYPNTLEQLVPSYIDHIPLPEWGTNIWEYNRAADKKRGYSLGVRKKDDDYVGFEYDSPSQKWVYDQ